MAADAAFHAAPAAVGRSPSRLPLILILLGTVLTLLFIVAPVIVIFVQALSKGWSMYAASILQPDTLHAVLLTVVVTLAVVPVNLVFGVGAAWLIAKFDFPGKKLLLTLIEIPFSISPIVAGVTYILLYGGQGLLGDFLVEHDIQIMFALPAIILVTLFVTSPFVARELIPLMQAQGSEQEEAATTLGAAGWQIFWRVTLLYGTILCAARAIGEFGAVSVVSGNVRGETNTLPLQIELLYHDYNAVGAFAAASTLTVLALLTLVVKAWLERRIRH
jgi:sulfate transport system permease protein